MAGTIFSDGTPDARSVQDWLDQAEWQARIAYQAQAGLAYEVWYRTAPMVHIFRTAGPDRAMVHNMAPSCRLRARELARFALQARAADEMPPPVSDTRPVAWRAEQERGEPAPWR